MEISGWHLFRIGAKSECAAALVVLATSLISCGPGSDVSAQLWDLATTGSPEKIFSGPQNHSRPVLLVAFSPGGNRILTVGHANFLKVWDISNANPIHSLWIPGFYHARNMARAAFSADGSRILIAVDGKVVWTWNPVTGEQEETVLAETISHITFSADGSRCIRRDGQGFTVYDTRSWEVVWNVPVLHTHGPVIPSADGSLVFVDGTLWNTNTREIREIPTGSYSAATFSSDSSWLLIGYESGAQIWNCKSGKLQQAFSGHNGRVISVAFSPDATRVITGVRGGTVRLWNSETGALLKTFPNRTCPARSVAFSPDGRKILISGCGQWRGT